MSTEARAHDTKAVGLTQTLRRRVRGVIKENHLLCATAALREPPSIPKYSRGETQRGRGKRKLLLSLRSQRLCAIHSPSPYSALSLLSSLRDIKPSRLFSRRGAEARSEERNHFSPRSQRLCARNSPPASFLSGSEPGTDLPMTSPPAGQAPQVVPGTGSAVAQEAQTDCHPPPQVSHRHPQTTSAPAVGRAPDVSKPRWPQKRKPIPQPNAVPTSHSTQECSCAPRHMPEWLGP